MLLRSVILAAARSHRLEQAVSTTPITRDLVGRFVAGTTADDALRVARELAAEGLTATLDHLGEDTRSRDQATAARDEYLRLLSMLAEAGLTSTTEVSLKLSALGQRFDEQLAYDYAAEVCAAAAAVDTTVTLDMEDHTTTDSTYDILGRLRERYPTTGVALQAYLRRTEADCRDLSGPGSRVRLCKGAYAEPESIAYQAKLDVAKSYVRCLNILMGGEGYPMIATHDPRLIAIAKDRAKWFDRSPDEFEFQMLYGIRPREQRRLVAEGYRVRVYVPYGTQWYPYLMRRLAERPANVGFFLRALRSRD
ncbi:MAG TPA: proline dehydrogenase family protein [Natronosporangium sp.]|nr:proline dehydrogenase family protein [Natronosporangium sp.]